MVTKQKPRPRFLSFALGLVMGLLLVTFQRAQIQPLSWFPRSWVMSVQKIVMPSEIKANAQVIEERK